MISNRTKAAAIAGAATLLLTAGVTHGQATKTSAPKVTGRWSMTVEGSPHGTMTMGLTLEQSGEKVTGTFASPHGDMPVSGDFIDGTLTLATKAEGDTTEISFNAKLKEDDTLSGYLSSGMGDMTWTATRVKERR